MLLLLLTLHPASAACPATAQELRDELDVALEAYGAFDWDGFSAQLTEVDTSLTCLIERVPADTAADLHLVQALGAFMLRDEAQVQVAFRGALAAAPGFALSEELAPPGHPLRALYEQAAAVPPPIAPQPLGPGDWIVDGERGLTAISTERTTLVQRMDKDGEVETWYLRGGPVPEALLPPPPPPEPERRVRTPPSDRTQALLWSSLGAGVVTAGAVALAGGTRNRVEGGVVAADQYGSLRAANRVGLVAAPVAGAAAIGLGVGAALTWRW